MTDNRFPAHILGYCFTLVLIRSWVKMLFFTPEVAAAAKQSFPLFIYTVKEVKVYFKNRGNPLPQKDQVGTYYFKLLSA